QFISSPPNSSIIGVIGKGVVLPCHVAADNIPEVFSVQWIFHEESQKITVSRYDGKNKKEKQGESYQGRTEFFHSEFRAGNMSLHLKNVRTSDKGSYTCVVSFNATYHDVLIELQVAAKGGVPSIFLRSHMKQGIGLTCRAAGWFPKPEVLWLDGQGQVRKELSTTKMTMTPAGLYSVITSMNLEPGSDMEVSCRMVNNLLNATSESRVLISGGNMPGLINRKGGWDVAVGKTKERSWWKRSKSGVGCGHSSGGDGRAHGKEKKRLIVKHVDLCVERGHGCESSQVPLSAFASDRVPSSGERLHALLNWVPAVEGQASEPAGPSAPSAVPVLVGKEGFAAGKHYWEVEVGQQQGWVLGVVREKGRQEEEGTLPGQDYWALHRSQGEIFSSEGDRRIEKLQMSNSMIGVLLDLEEGQVNFYEAERMRVMVRMPLRLGKEPAERFY
ncbi:Butyrophilin subfamily 3 member A3, partial [Phalacrocorax carbo]